MSEKKSEEKKSSERMERMSKKVNIVTEPESMKGLKR